MPHRPRFSSARGLRPRGNRGASTRIPSPILGIGLALAILPTGISVEAAEFDASDLTTLREAIDDAAVSLDTENFINITEPIIEIPVDGGALEFSVAFDGNTQVTVRPDPAADFDRAAIVSHDPFHPIIHVAGGYYRIEGAEDVLSGRVAILR